MTRRANFTQADVKRAVEGVKDGGETVTGVEFYPDGRFRVLTIAEPEIHVLSPLEAWERDHGDRAA